MQKVDVFVSDFGEFYLTEEISTVIENLIIVSKGDGRTRKVKKAKKELKCAYTTLNDVQTFRFIHDLDSANFYLEEK